MFPQIKKVGNNFTKRTKILEMTKNNGFKTRNPKVKQLEIGRIVSVVSVAFN